MANIKKGLGDQATDNYEEATHYFICGPTMVQREEVHQAKRDGKKIVLRLDNAVRNSRNRNTGMSRMKDFAQLADVVIYQSQWAFDYLFPFTQADGQVIINGCDQSIFNLEGRNPGLDSYLYSRYNRDETKNFEMARYEFSQIHIQEPASQLTILGNFSDELKQGNFDFYNNENVMYLGVITDPKNMAKLLKTVSFFLYSYFNDACSNTLIEALSCGVSIHDVAGMLSTGGAPEIMDKYMQYGREYFSLERMTKDYVEALSG